jgi:penicillin-binding protein 2
MKATNAAEDPQKQGMVRRRHFSFRINAFFFCIFVLFTVLIVKLALLQFVEGKQLSEREMQNSTRDVPIAPIRGNIYDSDGYPIASSYSVQSLFFRYGSVNNERAVEMAKRLEEVFAKYGKAGTALSAEEIVKRMDIGVDVNMNKTAVIGYSFVPRKIKSGLSQKEIAYLMENRDEFPGFEIMEESARVYDPNLIAVQLVGYVRPYSTAINQKGTYLDYYTENKEQYMQTPTEYVGFDGLEFMYQEELRGKNGMKSYPINAAQKIIGPPTVTSPEKGHNLILTIQKDIQLTTQQAIRDHLEKIRTSTNRYERAPNARSGYAVAMEVDTGNVVAMASIPDYDPTIWLGDTVPQEEYNKIRQFVNNGTIRTSYPDYPEKELANHPNSILPLGSTIKPLTILVGLSEKLITTTSKYYDTGIFYFGRGNSASIQNDNGRGYGELTPVSAIARSSNTYMSAMIGNPLALRDREKGLDVWDSYMEQFGLGVLTGSGLPNEIPGIKDYYLNVEKGTDSYQSALVRASWGQQGRYTTLQLAQYAAMLANRGKRMKPQFVREIQTYEGETLQRMEPEVLNTVNFPNAYWDVVVEGMKGVHVEGFDGFPYKLAAKTGTSNQQVANGTIVANAVFIAFAPADKPKLAVAVVIPEGGYGAWGAAPIARKIFDAYDVKYGLDGVPHPERANP